MNKLYCNCQLITLCDLWIYIYIIFFTYFLNIDLSSDICITLYIYKTLCIYIYIDIQNLQEKVEQNDNIDIKAI